MSLLDEMKEKCILLNKSTTADGYGGYNVVWSEGVEFEAVISLDNSTAAQVAEKAQEIGIYRVLTSKNLTLQYHDVFRRLKDGKVFRVTTDGDDNYTPPSASLQMRLVKAEEFEVSDE